MPFIDTKLNFPLSEEKEAALKAKLGEAIAVFPGKNEYWLMLNFSDSCRMWFRGHNSFPIAMVEVKLFGAPKAEHCQAMTREICRIFGEELALPADRIYVEYSHTDQWGWNGENF
ncbi:MAG: hypothetical protein IKC31_01060 [Clostridia bacterium]|nr:hypothetical protein [Clostridia bacterium]MBR2926150.1 hypothetical protein [Clostridia bacterium]